MTNAVSDQKLKPSTWDIGFGFEDEFKRDMTRLGAKIERADAEKVWLPDFVVEVKTNERKRTTPFLRAQSFVGIHPSKCIVIDMNKLYTYFQSTTNMLILFDIDYTPRLSTIGKYVISTNRLKTLLAMHPERKKTFRDHERMQDVERFYLSIDEMHDYEAFLKVVGESETNHSEGFVFQKYVDAKKRVTPFFKAQTDVGIPASHCLTIDTHKLHSYIHNKDNTLLVFDVDYTPKFQTKGKYIISTKDIKKLMAQYPHRLKTYMDHEKKIEKPRFYISVDEMFDYEDFEKIIA